MPVFFGDSSPFNKNMWLWLKKDNETLLSRPCSTSYMFLTHSSYRRDSSWRPDISEGSTTQKNKQTPPPRILAIQSSNPNHMHLIFICRRVFYSSWYGGAFSWVNFDMDPDIHLSLYLHVVRTRSHLLIAWRWWIQVLSNWVAYLGHKPCWKDVFLQG